MPLAPTQTYDATFVTYPFGIKC